MEEIKQLMQRYETAQQAGCEAAKLKKQIIPLLKEQNLLKTKFKFGDKSISYNTYNDYESINQKLLKSVLTDKYPQINQERFIYDLYNARKSRKVDTLRITTK